MIKPTSVIDKASSGVRKSRMGKFVTGKTAPISTSTGGGQQAISLPPTLETPPSAVAAVDQQLDTSTHLQRNSFTGGATDATVSQEKTPKHAYAFLGVLGVLLLFAFAWDKGKL